MGEWLKPAVLKTADPQGSVSSNLTLSSMAKPKTEEIQVTATFRVTFTHKVTKVEFARLDKNEIDVSEVVDESVAYNALATDGECEMEWDYKSVSVKVAR